MAGRERKNMDHLMASKEFDLLIAMILEMPKSGQTDKVIDVGGNENKQLRQKIRAVCSAKTAKPGRTCRRPDYTVP